MIQVTILLVHFRLHVSLGNSRVATEDGSTGLLRPHQPLLVLGYRSILLVDLNTPRQAVFETVWGSLTNFNNDYVSYRLQR